MTTKSLSKAFSSRQQKVEFLRKHPEFWSCKWQVIKRVMVREKLISEKTCIMDIGIVDILSNLSGKSQDAIYRSLGWGMLYNKDTRLERHQDEKKRYEKKE